MPLHFLHFDTSMRTDPKEDPFNCTLVLANPMRKIKKIYLKSCEIPLGFFNVRTSNEFTFTMFHRDQDIDMTYEDYTFKPTFNPITLVSVPNAQNFYFAQDSNPHRSITPTYLSRIQKKFIFFR